ncbi:MAG: S-layer protein domain-containing protein [Methanothrix sp.]
MRSRVRLLLLTLLSIFAFASANAIDAVEIRGAVAGTVGGSSNLIDNSFTWDQQNFAGFYFDLDKDLSTESLQVNLSNENVDAGAVEYKTYPKPTEFEHDIWGNYLVLCFLGQKYFAGYPDDCQIAEAWNSLEEGKILSQVIIDSSETKTIADDEILPLKEGYSLKLSDTDEGVKILLYKGGNVVDSKVITPPADYVYSASLGNRNVTLLAVGIKANVKAEPKSYYSIKGLFQISEKPTVFDQGAEYGIMKVASSDSNGLVLKNIEGFNLSKKLDLELMDDFGLKLVNSEDSVSNTRLYLYKNATQNDTAIRGAVATADFQWNPHNFAGFYYDIKNDIGTETLSTTLWDNKLSGDSPYGLKYETTAQKKEFEYEEWGSYNIIGFLGRSFLMSYLEDSPLQHASKDFNLLGDSRLGRILIDSVERQTIQNGGTLSLQDGFEAKFYVDKSCNKTLVELYRNGTIVDRNYLSVPGTYIYRKSLANVDDIAVLALHVAETDCTPGKSCVVDGIFQISEDLIDVNPDTTFGKMTITSVDANYGTIIMENKNQAITLSKNIDLSLMSDLCIKTANSDELRYYIYRPLESV